MWLSGHGSMDAWLEKQTQAAGLADALAAAEVYFTEDNCKHRGWLVVTSGCIAWLEKSVGTLHIPTAKLVKPVLYRRDQYSGMRKALLGGYIIGVGRDQYHGIAAADAQTLNALLAQQP